MIKSTEKPARSQRALEEEWGIGSKFMKVYLAMPGFDHAFTEKCSVVVMASTNDWNDLGSRFLARIVVRISSNDKIFSTDALVGCQGT